MTAGNFDAYTSAGHLIRINWSESGGDPNTNVSNVHWWLEIYRAANRTPHGSDGNWSVNINGATASGGFSYNFGSYSYLLLAQGDVAVAHDAVGNATIYVAGYAYIGTAGGSANPQGYAGLDNIPRATQPTVSPASGNTDATYTISYAGASSGFTHDLYYSLNGGASYTAIAGGLPYNGSTNWTPASSLIPNASSVNAIILLNTNSGGTLIGQKTVSLPLTVPATVKPSVSSVAWADDQTSSPDIPTLMGSGNFVQGWSKLKPTVTAAGSGGSTITSSTVTIAGQSTTSGVAFGLPVTLSGAVPATAVAIDSRTRNSDPYNTTVTVKAYNFPNLPVPTVQRTSDSGGTTPSPTGTYLAILPLASVSDLTFGGVQKNVIEYKIEIAPKTTGVYTTVSDWGSTGVSGTTWTAKRTFGIYASSSEWLVRVSLRDVFGKNGYNTGSTVVTQVIPVASEAVLLDIDANYGFGFGKYRQQGIIDIKGDTYMDGGLALTAGNKATQNNGKRVLDVDDGITFTGTVASTWNGIGLAPVTLNTGASVNANLPYPATAIKAGSVVIVHQVGANYYIENPYQVADTQPRLFDLTGALATAGKAIRYGDNTASDPTFYAPVHGWRLISGEVMLHGLVKFLVNTALNDVLLTLPVELRPLTNKVYFTLYNNVATRLFVGTNGQVTVGSPMTAGSYMDFSGIRFNNNPNLARTTMVLNSASSWVTAGGIYSAPTYVADDGYGRKFWEGVVKGGAPNTNIALASANPGISAGSGIANRLLGIPDGSGSSRMDVNSTALYRASAPTTTNPSTQLSLDHAIMTDAMYATAAASPIYYGSTGSDYGGGYTAGRAVRMGDGAIRLSGLVVANAAGVFARLPTSMAPKQHMMFWVENTDNANGGRIDIETTGTISLGAGSSGSGSFTSLEGIQFMPAEAWDKAWGNI